MQRTLTERTSAERIDELLKANEDYRQRAIDAETLAKGMEWRLKFWVADREKHSTLREEAQNEVKRLELKLAGSMPSLFDHA